MQVTPRSRRGILIQNLVFVVLFLAAVGLLAWLSHTYSTQFDWTAGNRHTLSEPSRTLLERMEGPITITAYARQNETLRQRIEDLISRYRRAKPDVELEFVNPDTAPERVRDLGITVDGELVIEYQGRTTKVQDHKEPALTTALQRVARQGERKVAFLTGHGERAPNGRANHDLGRFVRQLETSGTEVTTLNLTRTPEVPEDVSLLVVAGPQTALLEPEVEILREHVADGGNLLWLADPGDQHGLAPLAGDLGVELLPGTVVDATTRLFGAQDPALVPVVDYPDHPVTADLDQDTITLFSHVVALEAEPPGEWSSRPLLRTLGRSWTETGGLEPPLRYDEGTDERAGPLTIGLTLTRPAPGNGDAQQAASGETEADGADAAPGADDPAGEQRVAVIGDGDFLSNAFLGNGSNLDLGLGVFHWLTQEEQLIAVRPVSAPDTRLQLSRNAQMMIAAAFVIVLPLGLAAAGIVIWLRRRRR